MTGFLQGLIHDVENFNYIPSDNMVVVEGSEQGIKMYVKE